MKRRLIKFATAASLVLCVATAALWMRSNWRKDVVVCVHKNNMFLLASRHNRLGCQFDRFPVGNAKPGTQWYFFSGSADDVLLSGLVGEIDTVRELDEEPSVDLLGIEIAPKVGIFFIPHWLIVLLLSMLPVYRFAQFLRRRQRVVNHRCPTCGYDIRATLERCPECGREAVAGEAAS